ncbi:acyloxyacyl hydrolase [Namhaeicola litoreus]|uniref:Acyloxyacyl hydrolase n=1 Tax=Namhaeicola litoreus TaxID=1052145 RepID=A0ABW3Y1U1_9FLAO
MRFVVIFSFLFYSFASLNAQTNSDDRDWAGRFRYLEIKGHTGGHLYTGNALADVLANGYGAIEVRYGWQPSDPEHWTNAYGFSSYGLGWYSGYIGDLDIFGNPNALFAFINFPLSSSNRRNVFQVSPALGLAYNLIPYDENTNPSNDAIGAEFAFYIHLGFGAEYRLTRETDLLYGVDVTHFSNGRTFTPNYGLNMFGINVGLRYLYNADQKKIDNDPFTTNLLQARFKRPKSIKPTRLNSSQIEVFLGGGTVQNEEDRGTSTRYYTFSGALDYKYKLNKMHGFTAGLDLFYDESLVLEYPDSSDRFLTGAHLGYDFMFGKFALRVQGGTYLGDDKGKDKTYVRAALQYHLTDWLFAQAGLKTKNGSRADWAEFGLGFIPFNF